MHVTVVEVRVVVHTVWALTVAGTTLFCAAAGATSLPLGKEGGMSPCALSPRDRGDLFNREGPKGLLIFLDTLVCVVYGMRSLSVHLYSIFYLF